MRVLAMLPQGHHHRQLAFLHDIVGLADIADAVHHDAHVLNAHATRPVAIGDIVAGVIVELGAEEPRTPLTRTSTVPAEPHDFDEEVLKFRRVFRGDQHHMTGTALVCQEAAMRTAGLEGARCPLLRIEQLMLIADRIAEANQLAHPALLTQLGITTGELDPSGTELLQGILERHAPDRLPAYVGDTVDLSRMEGEAMTTVVDTEIQRVRIALGGVTNTEPHHLRAVLAPSVDVRGLEAHVANANDVHDYSPVLVRFSFVPSSD